jgi:simple sugar transport system ATP-binding protein
LKKVFHDAQNQNIAFIPEDRHDEGLVLDMPAFENYILGNQYSKKIRRFFFFLKNYKIKKDCLAQMEKYDIRPNDVDLPISKFSGGNQQKLIIAREFEKNPSFIIAANPTRGVDIGAIDFIHNQIIQHRDSGAGVLLVSSDLDEIIKLSDRIIVIYHGVFVAQWKKGEVDGNTIGLAMCGGVTGENRI